MNDQKIRRPRQADIATLAGVSVSTVSRVLANEPGISETVRRQILKVAAEHGYPVKPASEAVAGGAGADCQRRRHGRSQRFL